MGAKAGGWIHFRSSAQPVAPAPSKKLHFYMIGNILKTAVRYDSDVWPDSYRISLLRCPGCQNVLVAQEWLSIPDETDDDNNVVQPEEWSAATRLWPEPVVPLSSAIPATIRKSLVEARACVLATAYTASVAMSGRAIEAMCRHFNTKKDSLFEGLKELHERKIVDDRLYNWGDALRQDRNLAAHATGTEFSLVDAKDLYDFAIAICEYVFVLTNRFDRFNSTKQKRAG